MRYSGGHNRPALWRRPRGDRGQIAILFALVFTFMFILFCFVVNIGHLINAKINLQIAADAAAYAGAAWQARTLNKLGQLNYRIRQDVKEMAMRVQVTHLRHNRNFPRGSNADAPPQVEPFICQQAHGYRAISGLRYANDTNLCRNASPSVGGLPPIVVPPVIAAFDPFAVAIASQIRKIAEAANQECRAAAEDNRVLAQHLIAVYSRRTQFHAQQMQTVADWLNGLVGDDNHPINRVARESALRNTSLANRDVRFEVLRPQGGRLLQLNEHRMRGSLFFVNFNVVGDGCVGRPSFIDFDNVVALLTKEQPIITYYSVKLSMKPELFFMPEAWADAFPEIVAISSAKPFGSRVGPDSTADQLVPVANRPGNNNRMVNFSFRPGDNLGIMNQRIMSFLDSLHPFNGAGRPDGFQGTGWPDANSQDANLRAALAAIRAPTVFDALLYTIFPDPNQANDYLEPDYAVAAFPDNLEVFDAGNQNVTPNAVTTNYFPAGVGPNGRIAAVAQNVSPGGPYGNYASEAGSSHSVQTAQSAIGQTPNGWATREQVHSGWAPNGRPGRIGYSVKFIGMDALQRTMIVKLNESGGRGRIANPPEGDPNLQNIYH